MGTEAKIRFIPNPRYSADAVPVYFGSSKDSRIIYDGSNDEWTVQTKDAGGSYQDRLRVEANTTTPDIDAVDLPIKWTAGRAVTAADYSVGRDADGTNQLHFNVPTGAGFEVSINDTPEVKVTAGALAFQKAFTLSTATGNLSLDAAAGSAIRLNEAQADVDVVVESDSADNLMHLDASIHHIGLGGVANANSQSRFNFPAETVGADASFNVVYVGSGQAITVQNATTSAAITSLNVQACNLTLTGSGAVTTTASLYVADAATEGTNNYGLYMNPQTTVYGAGATNVHYAYFGIQTHTATSARTLVNVSTVYIAGAPDVSDAEITATNGPYALWVDDGICRFDGEVEMNGDLNHDGSNVGFFSIAPQAQQATIVDADGTLADITTKFNTLLADLEGYGLLANA